MGTVEQGTKNLCRYHETATQEQLSLAAKKGWERRKLGLQRQGMAQPNGALRRTISIAVQERVGMKYVKGSSRTLILAGAPWGVDEMLEKLEGFAEKLRAKLGQDKAFSAKRGSPKVVDFSAPAA